MLIMCYKMQQVPLSAFICLLLLLLLQLLTTAAIEPTTSYTILPALNADVITSSADSYSNGCISPNFWNKLPANVCPSTIKSFRNTIYLLYDVNLSEGFNLRRDVYIRLAVFVRRLSTRHQFGNVRLVLPPWPRLYHWHTFGLKQVDQSWSSFFDLESLRRFAPVLDFYEFLDEVRIFGLPSAPYIHIDQVYRLMHFEDMLHDGVFLDKFEILQEYCNERTFVGGHLLRQPLLHYKKYNCMRFQGSAGLLEVVLIQTLQTLSSEAVSKFNQNDVKVLAILSAEVVLHDNWGDAEFWRARRSMRFALTLQAIAAEFRSKHMQMFDGEFGVQRPPIWEAEQAYYRRARGGNYICAHLRRGDFLQGRQITTPTIKSAAAQIKRKLRELNLTMIFIATDGTPYEVMELREEFYRYQFVHFTTESQQQKQQIKDGGVAIVDQLICSHAHYFIGTYESTFTYRIYEEREILGFPKYTTFNTFCKHPDLYDCPRNTVWSIVY